MELNGKQFQTDILDFMAERWKGKRPPIRRTGLAQEELAQGIYSCVANLDHSQEDYEPKPWEEGC
jgi:hypothetical protein